jgi:hypothetical protein
VRPNNGLRKGGCQPCGIFGTNEKSWRCRRRHALGNNVCVNLASVNRNVNQDFSSSCSLRVFKHTHAKSTNTFLEPFDFAFRETQDLSRSAAVPKQRHDDDHTRHATNKLDGQHLRTLLQRDSSHSGGSLPMHDQLLRWRDPRT